MKLNAHLVRRLVRLIPAVLIAGVVSTPSFAGSAADINPKLAPYAHIKGAEKISLKLLQAAKDVKSGEAKTAAAAKALAGTIKGKNDGVVVEVICSAVTDKLLRKFAIDGIEVSESYPDYNRVLLNVSDLSALAEVAALQEVVMVKPVFAPVAKTFQGVADGRGRTGLNATQVVQNGNVGQGQIIGILSDSFAHTTGVQQIGTNPPSGFHGFLTGSRNQSTGDLPAGNVNIVRDDQYSPLLSGKPPQDEGAAMAELVHDVAPGAGIAFHTANGGHAIFADGITRLHQEAGATVIVDDVLYVEEPMYQDGIIAQSAAKAVKSGVAYLSAAGNAGDHGVRMSYKDINPDRNDTIRSTSPNDLHDWGGGNAFLPLQVPVNGKIAVVLQWNQPFVTVHPKPKAGKAGARVDLDLYLVDDADVSKIESPLESSTDAQGFGPYAYGDAFEILQYTNSTNAPETLFLAVDHVLGSRNKIPQNKKVDLELRLVVLQLDGDAEVVLSRPVGMTGTAPTMYGHSVAAGVASVGAVPFWESPAFDPTIPPTTEIDPEYFSSRGGDLSLLFNNKGKLKKRSVRVPTFAAVDGGDTSFFGGFDLEGNGLPNFFGTSAAAPNAAAVVALVRTNSSGLKPSQLIQKLSDSAIDVKGERAGEGWDDVSGAGLVNAGAALNAAGAKPNLYVEQIVSGDQLLLSHQIDASEDSDVYNVNDNVYLSFAVANSGGITTGAFQVTVRKNGSIVAILNASPIMPGFMEVFTNVNLGTFGYGDNEISVQVDSASAIAELNETDNTAIEVVHIENKPDLAFVDGIKVNNSADANAEGDIRLSDPIYVHFTVRNEGGAAAGPSKIHVSIDGNLTTVVNEAGLASNATRTYSVNIGTTATVGAHNVCVDLDAENVLDEIDETDNGDCEIVDVLPQLKPNLAFSGEVTVNNSSDPSATGQISTRVRGDDDSLYVHFTVINNGDIAAGSSSIHLLLNGELTEVKTQGGLAASGTETFAVDLGTTAAAGEHTICVQLDATNAVDEIDETQADNESCTVAEVVGVPLSEDNFAEAITITTDLCLGTTVSSNLYSTAETGEPMIPGGGGNTIWFSYTASSNTFVTFNTAGSTTDTVMAAYSNYMGLPNTFAKLTLLATNDNISDYYAVSPYEPSQVTISAEAGRTYFIQVDGKDGAQGDVRLNWACEGPRARNFIERAESISAELYAEFSDSNKTATPGPGEPVLFETELSKSMWYTVEVTSEALVLGEDTRPVRITVRETSDTLYTIDPVTGVQADKPRFDPVLSVYTDTGTGLVPYAFEKNDIVVDPNEDFVAPGYTGTPNGREVSLTFAGFVGSTYTVSIDGQPLTPGGISSSGRYQIIVEQLPNE